MSSGVTDTPLPPDADLPEQIEWQGSFVEVRRRGRWEYAGRPRNIRAAAILALEDGHVLLVEQYRVPVGRRCLELPAGLIGDEQAEDDALTAAARELEEETGYRADVLENCGDFYSSTGMLSESYTLVKATGLTRIGPGGGTEHEDIVVHKVPVPGVAAFVDRQRALGHGIDSKILLLLASGLLKD